MMSGSKSAEPTNHIDILPLRYGTGHAPKCNLISSANSTDHRIDEDRRQILREI